MTDPAEYTDLDEYKVELARRRQIGLTIDPAHAETTVRVVDWSDPYDIRDESHHLAGGFVNTLRAIPAETGSTLATYPVRRTTPSGNVIGAN